VIPLLARLKAFVSLIFISIFFSLEYLDEMSEMGIQKNVIIFGAALSAMEKCCRADISFQLMERMKLEHVAPNVHIYNSIISACARSNLWEKGYEVFQEMDKAGVARDVVTYNAVLDAVSSQIALGRKLFQEGVEKGFYARVSRVGTQWFELDLHFLSLGGGEIALGWWFEECLLPYIKDTEKLKEVNSISIVTGYGKTRLRGRRQGDDGMRKRVKAMLRFMNIKELPQNNAGRIHVDKDALISEVEKNGGRIKFDLEGYIAFKEAETTEYHVPDVPQKIRARFRPVKAGSGRPPFIRVETDSTSPEYRLENQKHQGAFDGNHSLQEDLRPRGNRPEGGNFEARRAPEGPGRERDARNRNDGGPDERHRNDGGPDKRHRNDGGPSLHSDRNYGSGRAGPQDAGRGANDNRRHGSALYQDQGRIEDRGSHHGDDRGSPHNRHREDQTRGNGGNYGARGPHGSSNDRYGPTNEGRDAGRRGDNVDSYPQDRKDSRRNFDNNGPSGGDRDRYPQDRKGDKNPGRSEHYGNTNSSRSRYPQDRKDNPPDHSDRYGPSSRGVDSGRHGGMKRDDFSDRNGPASRGNDSDRRPGVTDNSDRNGPLNRGNDSDRRPGTSSREREGGGSDNYGPSGRGGGSSHEDRAPSRDGTDDRGYGRKRDHQEYQKQQPNRGYSLDRDSTRRRHN
jgi:pentatricopeptide repeat protein